MSQTSLILELPYIQPAQAQKHVTHNEAMRVLDAIVQLSVSSASLITPPASPEEGARYLVPIGATGDWLDQDGQIAVFDTAVWTFLSPQAGWQAFVRDVAASMYFDGSVWVSASVAVDILQNVQLLGVNTTADATNPLSVAGDATLLNHAGSGHQLKINKAVETDTASLLFQTGYSGRAEMGAAGNDDFAIKVSADGSTWNTGAVFDRTTGRVQFPSGAQVSNRADVGGRIYCHSDNRWVTHNINYGVQSENISNNCGTGIDPTTSWTQMGAFVPKGAVLKSLSGLMRSSSTEVTGFDVQVFFQTGAFDTGWNSDAETTRTLAASQTGVALDPGFNRVALDLGDLVAAEDGFVTFYVRPIGTISATRYLYASLAMNYLTAA